MFEGLTNMMLGCLTGGGAWASFNPVKAEKHDSEKMQYGYLLTRVHS